MSHVCSIATVLKDVSAIEAACKELGLEFKRNQKTYSWWGTHVGDYPLPAGFTKNDLGKCEHAIGVPGTTWEVGVCRLKDGSGYTLLFDFFGSKGKPILDALGGEKAGKFLQAYGVAKACAEARKNGYWVQRSQQQDGSVKLVIGGMR